MLWPFNHYPGTDYETFNWDWLIKTVKEWVATMQQFVNNITAAWNAMRADWSDFETSMTDDWQDYQSDLNDQWQDYQDGLNDQWQEFIDDTYKDQITEILEDHPEWTTTVIDGAITKPKINAAFLREIENGYVTPEMYGALGDGTTDDSAAFQLALNTGKPVFLTPNKTYYLAQNITIPVKGVLYSIDENNTPNTNIILDDATINLSDRKITIKNLSIKSATDGTGTAFTWTGTNIRDFCFDNILLYGFNTCIVATQGTSSYIWRIIFNRIHTENCSTFIDYATSYSAFNINFTNCYFDAVVKLKGVHATFTSCNFGLNAYRSLNLEQSYIVLISCNLENDIQIDTQSVEFNQSKVIFIGCLIYAYQTSDAHFFEQRNQSEIIFINCEVKTKSGNAGIWWRTTGEGFEKYGNVIAWGTPDTILPVYTYSGYENSGLIFGTVPVFTTKASINVSKMYKGQVVYAKDTGLCIYDGTNIVKYDAQQ